MGQIPETDHYVSTEQHYSGSTPQIGVRHLQQRSTVNLNGTISTTGVIVITTVPAAYNFFVTSIHMTARPATATDNVDVYIDGELDGTTGKSWLFIMYGSDDEVINGRFSYNTLPKLKASSQIRAVVSGNMGLVPVIRYSIHGFLEPTELST